MNKSRLAPLALVAALSACSSTPIVLLQRPDVSSRAEVTVYRDYAFNAGGVSLAVGVGSSAFAILENSEYVFVELPPGMQEFFVRARSADPTLLKLSLDPGSHTCLRAVADPGNLGKVLLPPLLMASGYHFLLERTTCRSDELLAKYKQVPVRYRAD